VKIISEHLNTSLHSVNLIFFQHSSRVTDESLKNIGEGLIRLPYLRSIGLNFDSCYEISDEGVNNLGKDLSRITSLEMIDLTFSR